MSNPQLPYRKTRGQSDTDKFLESIRVAGMAQRRKLQQDYLNALNAKKAELLQAGVMPGELPEFGPNSSLADIATASRRMESLGRKSPTGAMKTAQKPIASTPAAPVAPKVTPALEQSLAPVAAALGPMFGVAANAIPAAASQAQVDELAKTAPAAAATVSAARQESLKAVDSASSAPIVDPNVRVTGAGREQLVDSQSGPRWVAAPLTGQAATNAAMGNGYAGLKPAQRAERLLKAMPTAPQAGTTVGGPQTILSDALGRNRTVGESLPGQTVMGKGTVNPDGTVASIDGAGVDITGGKTIRSEAGNVAVGKYGRGSSTFSRPPLDPSKMLKTPAQGSQVAVTSGVQTQKPTGPGTNLTGPASSTGQAYANAPRPPVPMPASSPIASNASAASVASPAKPPAVPELGGTSTAPAWTNPEELRKRQKPKSWVTALSGI